MDGFRFDALCARALACLHARTADDLADDFADDVAAKGAAAHDEAAPDDTTAPQRSRCHRPPPVGGGSRCCECCAPHRGSIPASESRVSATTSPPTCCVARG